ncbi:MAG: S1C family serine protease [Lachnospiraceae bacterium]|nr:S1C family serine protease [Lachnospiraceae bacterium]
MMQSEKDPNLKPDDEQYSFLRETIKTKTGSRVKTLRRILMACILGVVFGIFACLGFFALRPVFEEMFADDTNQRVTLAPEEEEVDDLEEPEEPMIEEDDEPEVEEEQDPIVVEVPTEVELTAERYAELLRSMYEIAQTANKSIVYIEGMGDQEHWVGDEASRAGRTTGLVIGDNGNEFLVLAYNVLAGDHQNFQITISDDAVFVGELRIQDQTRGLAVFAIPKAALSEENLEAIVVADLGNSSMVRQGDIVIAVGNILGHGDGVAYGILSSSQVSVTIPDSQFRILGTDISVSSGGTGFLFNARGQITGMIMPGPWQNNGSNTANALGISDIGPAIYMLVNDEALPFLGVQGVVVTEELAAVQEIPIGVYVSYVVVDSPAMAAGIQNGDVIIEIDGEEIETMQQFTRAILDGSLSDDINIVAARRGADGYVEMDFQVTLIDRR